VQVTTLANGLEIDWPRLVQYILNIQVNVGNVTQFISLDCLFAGFFIIFMNFLICLWILFSKIF